MLREIILAAAILTASMQPFDCRGGGSIPGGGYGSSGSPIEPLDPPPFCIPDVVDGGEICF